MTKPTRITSLKFRNYKGFEDFSVALRDFNVLVGPNNAGKSTVLGALRILGESLRKAIHGSLSRCYSKANRCGEYHLNLEGLPVSTENVFHNYDESEAAEISFRFSNGNTLRLIFQSRGACVLIPDAARGVRSVSEFNREFPFKITSVPILGPVEHDEPLFQKEAARLALLTHRASRNFRNIWYRYPDGFDEFRKRIRQTWPGMDILPPEIYQHHDRACLYMFCPEDRYPRELYWAGFGFQVWCQMLTFLLQAKDSSLLVIDEPDIYLHSDLQRQLVHILAGLGPMILLATHSTEIISDVECDQILHVDKRRLSAKRVSNSAQVQYIFLMLPNLLENWGLKQSRTSQTLQ